MYKIVWNNDLIELKYLGSEIAELRAEIMSLTCLYNDIQEQIQIHQ